jgi:SAM-dependent methyltransferase
MIKFGEKPLRKALRDAAFVGVRYVWCRANDFCLNIDTSDEAYVEDFELKGRFPYAKHQENTKHQDGLFYQAGNYRNIRRIIRVVQPRSDDGVYDIGCGKGRILCVFARLPVRRVVGIELDPTLAEAARNNANRLRGRRAPIEVRCQDAATADYDDGTIYLLYSPFGTETLLDVLGKIRLSLETNPRKITIVYYHAMFGHVFDTCHWLEKINELKTLVSGYPITFFTNRSVLS